LIFDDESIYFILLSAFFSFGLSALNTILIKNVNVWDGTSNKLNKNVGELIEDNLIQMVAKNNSEPNDAFIINGSGKTLIPELSDAHVYLSATMNDRETRNDAHWMYTSIRTAKSAENFLMLSFTTVRD